VSSYPQSGGIAVTTAGTLNTLGYTGLPITKNGFLYIWVSNETPSWDAFFDNLVVKQYASPLLEETHYYPFGLTMAGISSKALKPFYSENKFRYNGIEYDSSFGLDYFEVFYRDLDSQIGRWTTIDPKIDEQDESITPYSSMSNEPIKL
jgi:RHS repeat-associated protein